MHLGTTAPRIPFIVFRFRDNDPFLSLPGRDEKLIKSSRTLPLAEVHRDAWSICAQPAAVHRCVCRLHLSPVVTRYTRSMRQFPRVVWLSAIAKRPARRFTSVEMLADVWVTQRRRLALSPIHITATQLNKTQLLDNYELPIQFIAGDENGSSREPAVLQTRLV